jgi:bacteriocin-like protein
MTTTQNTKKQIDNPNVVEITETELNSVVGGFWWAIPAIITAARRGEKW